MRLAYIDQFNIQPLHQQKLYSRKMQLAMNIVMLMKESYQVVTIIKERIWKTIKLEDLIKYSLHQ